MMACHFERRDECVIARVVESRHPYGLCALLVLGALTLSACNSGSGSPVAAQQAADTGGSTTGPGSPTNREPTISGSPTLEAIHGVDYSFTPASSDADGDTLVFSVENLPDWASFDSSTGQIKGTPGVDHVGLTADIRISVSDGHSDVSLPSFSIVVLQVHVSITNTKPETLEWHRLGVGELVYMDEAIEFTRVPGQFRSLSYLRTANADQFVSGPATIEFDVDRPVDVLIGVDARATERPAWLRDWAATGMSLAASGTTHNIYSRRFEAGSVSLGGNEFGFSMYSVIVDDGTGMGNSPPEISGNPPRSVSADREYSFQPGAADIDGDALSFGADALPDWAMLDSGSGEIFGTPTEDDVGVHDVMVYVSDGAATTALPAFSITVNPPGTNSPPTISGAPAKSVQKDQQYTFIPTAGDPDDDNLRFTVDNLPKWANFYSVIGRIRGTPGGGDVGVYSGIVVHVSDGEETTSLPAFSITVRTQSAPSEPETNIPPTIRGTPEPMAAQDQPYSFTPSASDVNGDILSFSIENRPPWAAFSSTTGRISGTPDENDIGVAEGIVIRVSDGEATASLPAFSITVNAVGAPPSAPPPPPANTPPTISGSPATTVTQDQPYAFTPVASDTDGDALSFTISNRPAWASFAAATGTLSGTPGASHVGTYSNIVIRVSDGEDTASLAAFSIVVEAVNDPGSPPPPPPPPPPPNTPPIISGSPATSIMQDQAYSFTPSASDADADALSFTISNRPSWAVFNGTTGRLSGTPRAANVGTYSNIVIRVGDGEATAALPAFGITVNAAQVNAPPTISGSPATSVLEDQAYSFTPSSSDPDGDTLSYSISNRPSWASFSASTGRLSGTPRAGDVGTYNNIVITVSDGEYSASLAAFDITVNAAPNRAPTISGSPPTSVTQGQAYSYTPSANDPDGDTLSYSISNRPSWASFSSSTGRLSGTPGASHVGSYNNIVITVSDGEYSASLAAFGIQVVATATGSATLLWTAPTKRTDGSTLNNLAGFKVYWGTSRGNYPNSATINNPGLTTYFIDELTPGTWYFVATAIDTNGLESQFSNVASKAIAP